MLILSSGLRSQGNTIVNPLLLTAKWNAQWISCPGVSLTDYGVYHFRKTFSLQAKPEKFIINISADNRYRLFVNGTEVCKGPARGDLANWYFDTVDIAKYLKTGNNIIAAVVWNFGEFKPIAQMSNKTSFIIQGNNLAEELVNTDRSWKVLENEAYTPVVKRPAHTTVGPGDNVDGSKYPYGWNQIGFDDSDWKSPRLLGNGIPRGKFTFWDWGLIPRTIPFMEYRFQRIKEVERVEHIQVGKDFLEGRAPLKIPAGREVTILLDQAFLTTAYPEILVSGGKGSIIEISYAEALVDESGIKGNRNQTNGKVMPEYYSDTFRPDGGEDRHFQPLWFRTFRYMEITIETKENPLIIEDLYAYYTSYPFEEKASFKSSDSTLQTIWDVGWRTARLCAGETYYDCPYYEQLQYVGDTRIQALISLYIAGDDRLMRNAIEQFHNSLLPMGLTQSRFPSFEPQVIPTFSLVWIEMVYDFWMNRDDQELVRKYMNGIRNVLYWYQQQIDGTGMLGAMDWWNFVDWSFGPWNNEKPIGGTPKGAIDGNSSIITLQYAHALQMAAKIFSFYGDEYQAEEYRQLARLLMGSTQKLCWDSKKELLADTPKKISFSQHANIYAILTGMFDTGMNRTLLEKIINDKSLTQTTLYFKFYLVQAMKEVGLAKEYLNSLEPWREMIKIGLTTFAETPEPTRSDCHAWSASPNYHFLSFVCGINPSSPGFKTVLIEPNMGNLNYISAKMPHSNGDIIVEIKRNNKTGIKGHIILPVGLSGVFKWGEKEVKLTEGSNFIDF